MALAQLDWIGGGGGGSSIEYVDSKTVNPNGNWVNTNIAASGFDMLVLPAASSDWKTYSFDGTTLTLLAQKDAQNGLAAKIQNGYVYVKVSYSVSLTPSVYKIV